MQFSYRIVSAASAVLGLAMVAQATAQAGNPFSSAAYKAMLAQRPGLHSYVASVDVHTKLRSFPPVSFTFHGTAYFQAPDRNALKFDNVPGPLRGMVKDSPSLAPAALWRNKYVVTLTSDDGSATTFHLVSKASSDPLASADVTVDDQTGLVREFRFDNRNGSTVTSSLTYAEVGKYMMVSTESGAANGRGYKSDVTTTLSNYQINVPIPPGAFSSP